MVDGSDQQPIALRPEQATIICDRVAAFTGMTLDKAQQQNIAIEVSRRLSQQQLGIDAYLLRLIRPEGRDELRDLAEVVLNHETMFFRNMAHMRALQEHIIPLIHRRKTMNEPLRIWSAGCSTGEEPYSLAMVTSSVLGWPLPRQVDVWASDLSSEAVRKAVHGRYRGRTLRQVPQNMRDRYFIEHEDEVEVDPRIRSLVRFETQNLIDPFPGTLRQIDILFCQNVTIYFGMEACRSLMERFYDVLADDGYLFLGFSETLWHISDKFQIQDAGGAFCYTKRLAGSSVSALPSAALPSLAPTPTSPLERPHVPVDQRKKRYTSTLIQETLAALPRLMMPRRNEEPQIPLDSDGMPRLDLQEALLDQARTLIESGYYDQAINLLEHAPFSGPSVPRALVLAARAHAGGGNFSQALAEAQRAVDLDALAVDAYILLGEINLRQAEPNTALTFLDRARYLDPQSAIVCFYLAEAHRALFQTDEAMREYRNTLRKLETIAPETLLDGLSAGQVEIHAAAIS